jgi:hypothetical protein
MDDIESTAVPTCPDLLQPDEVLRDPVLKALVPARSPSTRRANAARLLARGGMAGALATIAMSASLAIEKKLGLLGEHPPLKIVRGVRRRIGFLGTSQRIDRVAAMGAHLAFGAAAGALFGLAHARPRGWATSSVSGAGFGMAVWATSYYGWVPALGLMKPPHRDRPMRPASMVAAHLLFGCSLGAFVEGFATRRDHRDEPVGRLARR